MGAISLIRDYFLVALFLSTCYVAFAPLFFTRDARARVAIVFAAMCLGAMFSGLCYVFSIIVGLGGVWLSVTVVAVLAVVNLIKYQKKLIPQLDIRSLEETTCYFLLFGMYAGLTFVTSIKMGFGEYPMVFFNMDIPLRLAQARQLVDTEVYPPESLMISGLFHAYHYGAPATVAFVSKLTGIPVHKSMFWVVTPLCLMGSFAVFSLVIRYLVLTKGKALVGMVFVLPMTFIGMYLNNVISGQITLNEFFGMVFGPLTGEKYDPESFGRGVSDISGTAGLFLLAMSVYAVIEADQKKVVIWAVLISTLVVLFKMDLVPVVFGFLGMALAHALFSRHRKLRSMFSIALTGVCCFSVPIGFLIVSGYFSTDTEMGSLSFRTPDEIMSGVGMYHFRDILFVSGLCIAAFGFAKIDRNQNENSPALRIVQVIVPVMFFGWLTMSSVDIPKVGVQFGNALWIGIPLVCISLLGIQARKLEYLKNLMLAPFLAVALIGQLAKLHHASVAVVLPDYVNEYSDNRLLGDALSRIPIERREVSPETYEEYVKKYSDLATAFQQNSRGLRLSEWGERHYRLHGQMAGRSLGEKTLLVTNDFRYLKWWNSQPVIPALFGHPAYGVHLRHFPGPDGVNRKGERRILEQLSRLSRSFSIENPTFAAVTHKRAKEASWTHFLLRKDLDDGLPPVNSAEVPLELLYENERYAVFRF